MKRARNGRAARRAQTPAHGVLLLSAFEPFGGEGSNPSWEVAAQLNGLEIGGLTVKAVRLPVNTPRAVRSIAAAIARLKPRAVLGLGQAGGRPAISLEQVAINLVERRAARESDGGLAGREIPAALSLSAGAYVCNSVMYATLFALRARPRIPAGFIHLPYAASQAAHHRQTPSMSPDLMTSAVTTAIETIARVLRTTRRRRRPRA